MTSSLTIDNQKSAIGNPPRPARVLIVDDHAIVRYGMGVLLANADDLTLCGEAGTYDEALTKIRELRPDVAVIDIILHDRSGLDLIRQIRAAENRRQKTEDGPSNQHSPLVPPLSPVLCPPSSGLLPHIPILVMSMHDEATHAEKALRAGAQGYIMKEDADEVIVEALRTLLAGKLYVSGNINEKLLRSYVEGEPGEENSGVESLTAREKEIFEGMGQGLTTRKIAEQFNLSPRTVEVHRAKIKKKLNCEDAAQLLRTAVQWVESR
jgi:DNA-binding NarL/FixJ family response regulator